LCCLATARYGKKVIFTLSRDRAGMDVAVIDVPAICSFRISSASKGGIVYDKLSHFEETTVAEIHLSRSLS
jgi:hypothetical protein